MRKEFVCPLKRGIIAFSLLLATAYSALAIDERYAIEDTIGLFPYVVRVTVLGGDKCSGTVIHPRIVITAAHCLRQSSVETVDGKVFKVYDQNAPLHHASSVMIREGGAFGLAEELWTAPPPLDIGIIVTHFPIRTELPLTALDFVAGQSPEYNRFLEKEFQPNAELIVVGFGTTRCDYDKGFWRAGKAYVQRSCVGDERRRYAKTVRAGTSAWEAEAAHSGNGPCAASDFCVKDDVALPGDSGGAVLLRNKEGKLVYVGVIWGLTAMRTIGPIIPKIQEITKRLG